MGAATIVAVDLNPARLELARELGATHVFDGARGDLVLDGYHGPDGRWDRDVGSAMTSTYRPDDRDFIKGTIRRALAESPSFEAVFAGLVTDGTLTITELLGTTTRSLSRLRVRTGEGIGGGALRRRGPVAVPDYLTSRRITHHHDEAVRREGLRSMAAVPVIVADRARAVIYAATRSRFEMGGRLMDALGRSAAAIEGELAVRDEVDRRLRMLRFAEDAPGSGPDEGLRDAVREAHAELLSLAASTDDPELARRIHAVTDSLAASGSAVREGARPRLTRRETDVLSHAALGCSYAEVGARLGLAPVTVKGYMRDVIGKLGARNRTEAVINARRFGLIP